MPLGKVIIHGAVIEGNGKAGVSVGSGHLEVWKAKIRNNGGHGVELRNASSARIASSEISGNVGSGIHVEQRADAYEAARMALVEASVSESDKEELQRLLMELFCSETKGSRMRVYNQFLSKAADYATLVGLVSPYLAILVGVLER